VTTVTAVPEPDNSRSAAPLPVTDTPAVTDNIRDAVTNAPPLTGTVTAVTDVTHFRERKGGHSCADCGAAVVPSARALTLGLLTVCRECA